MKILKLRASNINSFKGDISIDFEELLINNSIFAITGNTGSGKSTILDIISCALYAKTARLQNPNDLMTKDCSTSRCEVEFEIDNKRYLSSWTQRRANGKSDGRFQTAKMTISTIDDEKIIHTGLKEVPSFVEEISGLDFNKFMKSMMLAQGGFDAFLKAKEIDRSQLLERITGTDIYSNISKAVYQKHKVKEQKLRDKEIELNGFDILEDDILKIKNTEKDKCEKQKLELDRDINKIQEEIESETKIEGLKDNLLIIQKNIASKESNIKDLDSKYITIQENIENIAQDIQIQNSYIEENKKDKSLIENINLINENLENYKKEYNLQESIKNNLDLSQNRFNDLLEIQIVSNKELKVFDDKSQKAELDYRKMVKEVDEDGDKGIEFRDKISQLENFLENKSRLKSLRKETKDAKKIKKSLTVELQDISIIISDLKDDIEGLRESKQQSLLLQKYEDDRKELQSGKACYLCGSKKHPYIEHKKSIPKDKSSSRMLKKEIILSEKEAILKQLEESFTTIKNRVDTNTDILEKIKKDMKISNIKSSSKEIKKEIEKIYNELDDIIKRREKRDNYLEKRDISNKKFQTKKDELLALEKSIIESKESLNSFHIEYKSNQKEIERLDKILTSQWSENNLTFNILSCDSQYKELIKRRDNFVATIKKLEELIKKEQDIKVEDGQIKTKIDGIKKELEDLIITLNNTTIQYEKLKIEDNIELGSLKEQFIKKREESDSLQLYIGKIEQELEINNQNKVKSKDKLNEIAKDKDELKIWDKMEELIGSASGAKFAKFAQGITLDQLIKLANNYLYTLNQRYILVRPKREKSTKDILEISVTDTYHANITRPVSTLSGGESFIISLALALGLSELASQKISIDSLFLDEGFGTLDNENLEMAINALNNLQSSGKMVGVISHIEALKERIPTQIRVIANGDGTSRIDLEL